MPPRKIKESWIFKYADSILKLSESPEAYNVWCAISVIGSVLKNHVWIDRGVFKIFPNQYIILVGPPGVGKGAAMHPAHAFIKEHTPAPLANYIKDRVTAEQIIKILETGFPQTTIKNGLPVGTTEASATIMSPELPVFLGSSDWMLPFMCELWDRTDYDYGTKNKGSNAIKDMCVSLIGGCVPEFIRKINKDVTAAINGGFTARALFIFASDKSKSLPWPMSWSSTPATKTIRDDLSHDLAQMANLQGEFSFTLEARIEWERWYPNLKHNDDDSDVTRHFKSRQAVHVMKVAMCLSASLSDSLVIDKWCLTTAIALVQNVLNTLDITFRGVGESSLAEATAKIQLYLERKGMATRSQILKDNHRHCTGEDLDRILLLLQSIEFCDNISVNGRYYYRHTIKKGTNGTP